MGSFACRGRRGSRLVGCVRRFGPPPPPLVGVWPVVRPLFFSLAFSGFARSGLGVSCWCFLLFSPPFFCVPRPGSKVAVISSSSSFHAHFHFIYPAAAGCVCVCTICIDVKLLYCKGATAHLPMLPNEATEDAMEGFMDA